MYNLLIALAVGALSFVGFSFAVGGGEFKPLYGIVPALIVMGVAYFYLARRTMKQAEAIMNRAQEVLQNTSKGGGMSRSPKQVQKVINQAIGILKEGYPLDKWQFWIKPQIDGQIGQLLYMGKKYDQAEKYLKNSMKRHWIARAMLGALYYKRRDTESMKETFEEAVEANKKESMLWNLYAYCLWKTGKSDEAIEVLNRALEHMEKDEKTRKNLRALQNGKKMQMRGWNMLWYQFHLDTPPQQRAQMRFGRR